MSRKVGVAMKDQTVKDATGRDVFVREFTKFEIGDNNLAHIENATIPLSHLHFVEVNDSSCVSNLSLNLDLVPLGSQFRPATSLVDIEFQDSEGETVLVPALSEIEVDEHNGCGCYDGVFFAILAYEYTCNKLAQA